MSSALIVRDVSRGEWAAAAPIAARAFFDEEFVVGMFGKEPLSRWAGAHHFYAAETFDQDGWHLGAFIGDTQVGLIRLSPFGKCYVCTQVSPITPPEDPVLALDWAFEVQVLKAHSTFERHAWISRVAVEPQLHGTGIGKLLVDAALDRLGKHGKHGNGIVLLECLATREGFYAGRGFRRVSTLVDPYAVERALLMSADLPRDH